MKKRKQRVDEIKKMMKKKITKQINKKTQNIRKF